jgi:hypothetical protein
MSRFANFPPDQAKKLAQEVPQRVIVVDFTLTISVASSTLSNNALRPTSAVTWTPKTANASAEIGAGTIHMATPTLGAVVITHANSAVADRTFRVVILNP